MPLSREAIVDQLKEIVGPDRVITDETVLKKNSIDRFRKYADIHGVFTLPLPAAVVKLGSTKQVSDVLSFMNQHKINGVPRTGASAFASSSMRHAVCPASGAASATTSAAVGPS